MSKAKTAGKGRKPGFEWKQIVRLSVTLFIITAVSGAVLSLVNALTADTIAMRQEAARQKAMACVMPSADVFSDLYSENTDIQRISGAYKGTKFVGYCVEVSSNGFGGAIELMVGVNPNGKVTGVTILGHGETPGLGARAENPDFLGQYVGKSGKISVGQGGNAVNAITGATITSKAVTEGVNTAIAAVIHYNEEGGSEYEGDV